MASLIRCVLVILLGAPAWAAAQGYPSGPVRIVVPFPAGGGVDTMGRIVAQKLTEHMGRTFVIENRGGANGNIGTEIAAKSAKDGYTLLMTGAGFVTNPSLYAKPGYDPIRDFDAISLLSLAPNVLVVHPSLPAKSVAELAALARARPGQVQYGSAGSGSTPHLAAELFKTMAKVEMTHVPYRGTGPATIGLLAGEISVMFLPTTNAVPLARAGRVRGLAVTTAARVAALPELPTVAEAGMKGYESNQWYGMLAPAGTAEETLNALNAQLQTIMHSAEMKDRLTGDGLVSVGSTRGAFASHIKEEIAKWAKVIKQSGARID